MSGAGQGGRRGGRGGRGGGGGGGAGPSSSKELSFLMQRIRLPIELETDDDADDLVDPTDPKRWVRLEDYASLLLRTSSEESLTVRSALLLPQF